MVCHIIQSPLRSYALLALLLFAASSASAAEVAIDTGIQHQTLIGWGATTPWLSDAPGNLPDRIIDVAVNDLGITRLRFEGVAGNKSDVSRWEWDNDDDDPLHYNWNAFNLADFDKRVGMYVLPTKLAVEATGASFNIYVSPSFFENGSSGGAPAWLLYSPGEYAEFATSMLLRLRDEFGIEADHSVICNEAGNDNTFYPQVVGRMIKALGPRMAELGLTTGIQFPESINAYAGWDAISQLANDERVWRYINMLSYHLYGGTAYRADYKAFGLARGLPTAQTEYMSMTINTLYDDMIDAGTSVWEVYGQGFPGPDIMRTGFTRSVYFWDFRQAMHYIRPGAVRVEAVSDDSTVRVLAFDDGGEVTVLLINNATAARSVNLSGLPAGQYAVSQSVNHQPTQQLGLQTVAEGASLSVNVPRYGVMTVYPHTQGNMAPEINTCESSPTFLKLGELSMADLSVSATDPELDALSYSWSVLSAPDGALAALAANNASTVTAFGLTVPGEYAFQVTVSDGEFSDTSEVHLNVYNGNSPRF